MATRWEDTVPACLDYDPFMTFAEVVWHAQIELDLIAEGQDGTEHFTKRDIRELKKFVHDNRLTLATFQGKKLEG